MDLYQVCSNYTPGAKNGPAPGVKLYIGLYRENVKKSSWLKPQGPRALIFGMLHHQVDLFQVYSNYIPGARNGLTRGSNVLYRENMEKSSS